MKTLLLSVSALLVLLATACNTNDHSNQQQLQDEMIAVHDEVMPMMSTFAHNSMAIDSILTHFKEIKIENPEIDTTEQKEKLTALKVKLDHANDSMNDWMHDLNLDFDKMSKEEVKEYLEQQRSKVDDINKQFKELDAESKEALSPFQP